MSSGSDRSEAGQGAPAAKRSVVVTCADREGAVTEVAEHLRKLGFEVQYVLESAGSVVGDWTDGLDALREIPGVDDVEESEEKYAQ